MTGRVIDLCLPGCTCRGTNGLAIPETPCYDEAVARALDLIREFEASKARHPSSGGDDGR